MKFFLILAILLTIKVFCVAQYNADSLLNLEKSSNGAMKASIQNKLALVFRKSKEYNKSVEWALKAAETARTSGSKTEELTALMHVGFAFYYQSSYDKAADYFEKALKKYEEAGIKDGGYSKLLDNLSVIYLAGKQADKAIPIIERIYKIAEGTGNKNAIANANENLGVAYDQKKNYTKAIEYFKKAQSLFESVGNNEGVANELNYIGLSYYYFGNHDEALATLNKALSISKNKYQKLADEITTNIETIKKVKDNKSNLTQYDKDAKEKEIQKLNEVSNLSSKLKLENEKKQSELNQLSVENIEKEKKIYQKEAVISEKEKEVLSGMEKITTLTKENELQIEITRQQKVLIYGGIIVLVVILLFSFLLLRQFRLTKKAYKLLFVQKEEISLQKNQLEVQSEDILFKNSELEEKNLLITDSINYAKTIQEAILPNEKAIRQRFADFFIFYRPRDIVSGDFYWFEEINSILYFAVVDCTGHGVPGGFMSMIGNTLLNEIIFEKQIFTPSDILDKLNSKVISFLNKDSDIITHQTDGMDITVCRIDRKKNEIQMALANHTAFLISQQGTTIVEGDDYSIGDILTQRENHKYLNQVFNYTAGTSLFMFTDGYKDQFGGSDNRKFSIDKMQKLFESNYRSDMTEINKTTETTFDKWKGNEIQIDDVLIVGLKL